MSAPLSLPKYTGPSGSRTPRNSKEPASRSSRRKPPRISLRTYPEMVSPRRFMGRPLISPTYNSVRRSKSRPPVSSRWRSVGVRSRIGRRPCYHFCYPISWHEIELAGTATELGMRFRPETLTKWHAIKLAGMAENEFGVSGWIRLAAVTVKCLASIAGVCNRGRSGLAVLVIV